MKHNCFLIFSQIYDKLIFVKILLKFFYTSTPKLFFTKEYVMKRLLCIFIALVCVSALLASCDKKKESNEGKGASNADAQYLSHIEIEDFGGYNFRILSRSGMVPDQYVEEETGDIVNDAVYRRNEAVKALFNIDITAIESSTSNADDAINTILAGDDQYDIILPHSRVAFSYAIQNTVVDYKTIDTIDLSKEWWSQDIIESGSVNNHLYVLDGDISTHRLQYAFCMFFNKRIFDELGLDYPYQTALDENWTFDEFSRLVKQGSKDLNGDGILKPEDDQFGYYTWNWYGPINVLYSGGSKIYTNNKKGIPELTLNSPKTVEIFSKYFNLCKTDDVRLFIQMKGESDPAGSLFREGRAMFADMGLGSAKSLRNMNDEFGIIPWPKFTKEDKYATVVNGAASLMVMPVTVSDYNRSGKIIEALCAIGSRDVIPAFYDVSLKTKFARDYESEAMIDIVKNSIIYDLGYCSGGTFQSIGHTLAGMNNPDFGSYYAANETKALNELSNFIQSYGK